MPRGLSTERQSSPRLEREFQRRARTRRLLDLVRAEMSPESQQSQIARLQQSVSDLRDVVGRFGQMLVDQVRLDEQLKGALMRIKELEDNAEDDRKAREKDREDRRKFALTFAVSVAGVLVAFLGTIIGVITLIGGG